MGILSRLLEISIYSVILFLAVISIKMVLKNRMSPLLHFLIWFMLIARLCVPVTLDSGIRFIVTTTQAPTVKTQTDAALYESGKPATTTFDTPHRSDTQNNIPSKQNPITLPTAVSVSESPDTQAIGSWTDILAAAWLMGVFITTAWLMFTLFKMNRVIKRQGMEPAPRIRDILDVYKKEWGIRKEIPVFLLPNISTPALTVGFRPKLILPAELTETFDDRQLEFALKHELTHYKRKDHFTGLLLRVLQAVYWFNPAVWLMGKLMIADMETACDSMVIKTLDSQERKQYVLTLLDMFSSRKAPRFLIGMALSHTEKIAEKRIRGAYMNSKSKHSAKLIAGVLSVILFVGCFTTACQPTPEKPVVVNKADGLEDIIEATPSAAISAAPSSTPAPNNDALYEKLAAPKHWRFEEAALDGKLNLKADVNIELPLVTQLPAATAKLKGFSQEDLDKVAALFGAAGAAWTKIDHTMTKEQIQQEMIDHKARRAEFKAEGNTEMVAKMDEDLADYEQMYKEAPEEIKQKNIELKISELSKGEYNGKPVTIIGFEGTTEVNGQSIYFMANNSVFGDAVNRISVNYGKDPAFFGGAMFIDKPYGLALTKEQAGAQASEIAKQLTNDLSLCDVYPATTMSQESGREWGWSCVFMRQINGCPTAYESTEIGSDMDTTVDAPVPYECLTITMDDHGLAGFVWKTPMTVTSIDNPDVALLPFDEIFDRAKEHIIRRWAYEAVDAKDNDGNDMSDPGSTAIITKVNLGLMRVQKKDSDDYYYIPVWNFFSDFEHTPVYYERTGTQPFTKDMAMDENGNYNGGVTDGDPTAWGAITVNALDGSIIDRNLGY